MFAIFNMKIFEHIPLLSFLWRTNKQAFSRAILQEL